MSEKVLYAEISNDSVTFTKPDDGELLSRDVMRIRRGIDEIRRLLFVLVVIAFGIFAVLVRWALEEGL